MNYCTILRKPSITLDIETRSVVDLEKTGTYKYSEDKSSQLLLLTVSDGVTTRTFDIANGELLPKELIILLTSNACIKNAFNAEFERVFLSVYIRRNYPELAGIPDQTGSYFSPESWQCDRVRACYCGLPSSLGKVAEVLELKSQKMCEGKALIKLFCTPDMNGNFTEPYQEPEKWALFKKYNMMDVIVETEIQKQLSYIQVPDFIWSEYCEAQLINDRGILVDTDFADKAIYISTLEKANLLEKLKAITGLSNPNSVVQFKGWLENKGIHVDSLSKETAEELIKTVQDNIKEALILRQQLTKSSVKKYEKMDVSVCDDKRARGMFSYLGAAKTGRFSGRLIQLQNLPQNHIDNLEETRKLVMNCDYNLIGTSIVNVSDVLSQLIRTAFIPPSGKKFIVADYSAIEARVIAWLAGEQWRIEAFKNGEDIYCTSASRIFGVEVTKNGANSELRQKGKVAELACAYGGSVGAMKAMGGDKLSLSDEKLQEIITAWRKASPNIVSLWYKVNKAAVYTVKTHCSVSVDRMVFSYRNNTFFIKLPSGRELAYYKPELCKNRSGWDSISYLGVDNCKKWSRIETYGAKLVENIVQAIARDILTNALHNLKGYDVVAHVHDEVILEADNNVTVDDICNIMCTPITWAEGLLLKAEGYSCDFYQKH